MEDVSEGGVGEEDLGGNANDHGVGEETEDVLPLLRLQMGFIVIQDQCFAEKNNIVCGDNCHEGCQEIITIRVDEIIYPLLL